MSNKEKYSSDGKGRRNESRNCSQDNVGDDSADMKRAAEQKIKNYFFQLTDGCGSRECKNEYCASSGRKQTSKDDAAALALQLFMKKARLCEPLQDKNHKVPTQEAPFLTEKSVLKNLDSFAEEGSYKKLVHNIGIVFSSSESLNKSFLLDSASRQNSGTNVDIEAVRRMYAALFKTGDSSVENSLINSLVALSPTLEVEMRFKSPSNDPNFLNQFVIIMENTMLQSPEYLDQALPSFLKAMALLSAKQQANLVHIWSQFSSQEIRRMVETLQQLVTYQVLTGPCATSTAPVQEDDAIVAATKVMKLLYYASVMGGIFDQTCLSNSHDGATGGDNEEDPLVKELKIDVQDCRQPLVKYQEFVNDPLNDQIEVDRDYTYYKHEKGTKFSFLKYNFILSTVTKSMGLFYDNRIRMYSERRLTILYSLVRGEQGTPYLKLKVRRDHLIEDALVNLEMTSQDNPGDLKKQLYVEFEGEQGIDEGGVSKEFFQLVVEQIFNPDYGMFTFDEATQYCWFNLNSFETDSQFFLIGLVLGLAIYNNVILDVHFPMVVYRKLFGKKGTFEDLKVSHAGLAAGLQNMLDYKGDVESDFMCTFTIGYTDMFGMSVTKELKENGAEISVTNQNRQEFVDLYADFILNKSVDRQFKAFRRGFDLVVSESPLKTFFRPDEVELLVSGCQDFDFDALEKSTEYDNGLSEGSTVIRWFWQVVHEFTLEQKKQLLMFTTGSDRIPVGGFSKLKLVIAKNGPDSDRLPTAHTCFNVLLLPEYSSKEKLKERLLKAITHAKGFGLL